MEPPRSKKRIKIDRTCFSSVISTSEKQSSSDKRTVTIAENAPSLTPVRKNDTPVHKDDSQVPKSDPEKGESISTSPDLSGTPVPAVNNLFKDFVKQKMAIIEEERLSLVKKAADKPNTPGDEGAPIMNDPKMKEFLRKKMQEIENERKKNEETKPVDVSETDKKQPTRMNISLAEKMAFIEKETKVAELKALKIATDDLPEFKKRSFRKDSKDNKERSYRKRKSSESSTSRSRSQSREKIKSKNKKKHKSKEKHRDKHRHRSRDRSSEKAGKSHKSKDTRRGHDSDSSSLVRTLRAIDVELAGSHDSKRDHGYRTTKLVVKKKKKTHQTIEKVIEYMTEKEIETRKIVVEKKCDKKSDEKSGSDSQSSDKEKQALDVSKLESLKDSDLKTIKLLQKVENNQPLNESMTDKAEDDKQEDKKEEDKKEEEGDDGEDNSTKKKKVPTATLR